MSQTAATNVVCMACGADVRSDALFCYGCGAAIADGTQSEAEAPAVERPAVDAAAANDNGKAVDAVDQPAHEATADKTPARRPLTAAMLRRKKASNRQPVEVEWQVPENDSMLFAVASVGLTLFALLVLIAALYLR